VSTSAVIEPETSTHSSDFSRMSEDRTAFCDALQEWQNSTFAADQVQVFMQAILLHEVGLLHGSGKMKGQFQRAIFQFQEELPPISHSLTGTYSEHRDQRFETSLRENARAQRLAYYLGKLARQGDLSDDTALLAWRAWNKLSEAFGTLPVPDAAPGPNGELLYTWNTGEHHLELEIFADGSAELFYANRVSGDLWGSEYTIGGPFSDDVREKLRAFI
jgi:hypothetical protein